MSVTTEDPIYVTIELYDVYRAIHDDRVQQWTICLNGHPLITTESYQDALEKADRLGFVVVEAVP